FEDDSFGNAVRDKGAHTDGALEAIVAKHEGLTLRSKGMIHGIDFGAGPRAARASKEAFERGLIIATCGPGGRVLKVMAPLTIEQETLDAGLSILADAVDAAMEA